MKKALVILATVFTFCSARAQLPSIKPGDTCEKLRATYGKESSLEGPAHVWKQGPLTIRVLVRPGGPCVAGAVQFSIEPGQSVRTRDGILLGTDTIAEAALKLSGRINDTNYVYLRGEGKAYGEIEVSPSAAFPFKGTYMWQLAPVPTRRLTAPPKREDFTSEPLMMYAIDPPNPPGVQ